MSTMKQPQPENTFYTFLSAALKKYHHPDWLGQHSPLASTYFLGTHLHHKATLPQERGKILQKLLMAAAADLWGGALPTTRQQLVQEVDQERMETGNQGSRYFFYLLELYYFRQYFSPNMRPTRNMRDIAFFVNVGESSLYVHLPRAREELGTWLLKRINPTFRPEMPQAITKLVGRETILQDCLGALTRQQSVTLSGMGGMGKTTLGVAVQAAWPTKTTFWYTVRPTFNDHRNSLLFALAHFLYEQGQANLWSYLQGRVAQLGTEGTAQPLSGHEADELILGLLREDLHQLAGQMPLLCFDEVDRLQLAEGSPSYAQHLGIVELLDVLKQEVAVLLIGQRPLIDTPIHYPLQPLTQADSRLLLEKEGVELGETAVSQLHQFTNGNPRLLLLVIALHKEGENILALWQQEKTADLGILFNRLWQRLGHNERQMMLNLSVFRQPVPANSWPELETAVSYLIERQLVVRDQTGSILLQPIYRWHIYSHELTQPQRQHLHQQAANVRASWAEYTAAAYHFWQAEAYINAFQVWYAHYEQEIQRGQAAAARLIFNQMTPRHLQGAFAAELAHLQMMLDSLEGSLRQVVARVDAVDWPEDAELTAVVRAEAGMHHHWLGNIEAATAQYDAALSTITRLTHKAAHIYFQRGHMALRQRTIAAAIQAAHHIHYEHERLQGFIAFGTGAFDQAIVHYQQALHLAETVNDAGKQAATHYYLALLAGRRAQLDTARHHAQRYMDYCRQIGDRLQLEMMRAELAGMHLMIQDYKTAVELGEPAFTFFERVQHRGVLSPLCANLAEAYLGLGDLSRARWFANRVFQDEQTSEFPHAAYTLGLIYRQEQNDTLAIHVFNEGIRVANQNEDKFMAAYLYRELGKLYAAQANPAAQPNLSQARQLFAVMGLAEEAEQTDLLLAA